VKVGYSLVAWLITAATVPASELILRGGCDQLATASDIADLRVLATQILPANSPLALIECTSRKSGTHLYGSPTEQRPRLWRGFYFGCNRKDKSNNGEDGGRIIGGWVAYPYLWKYAVVAPQGKTLPPFPPEPAADFNPIMIVGDLGPEDIIAICDAIAIAPAVREKPFPPTKPAGEFDVSKLPIHSITRRSGEEVGVNLEKGAYSGFMGFSMTMRKDEDRWRITSLGRMIH
jgi:hypothetical protein